MSDASESDEPIPMCSTCGSSRVVPIIYGLPRSHGLERARRQEVMLGGCCLSADSPRWACQACGRQFGDHEADLRRLFERLGKARRQV